MGTVANPFSGSDFVWAPSAAAGSKGEAKIAKYVQAAALPTEDTALTLALADKAGTDLVITAQCVGAGDEYFRRDLRGAWFRDGATVTVMDTPAGSGDASANEAGYSAQLVLSGTDVLVKTKGPGRWTLSVNRLVTARDPFDPLSVGTPIMWIDATACTVDAGAVSAVTNKAGGGMVITATGHTPTFNEANADYADGPTIDCGSNQGFQLTNHGLTTGGFTLILVGDGVDTAWLQDANGNYLVSAGGGSGNDLQITSDAATYINTSGSGGNESGVPGVFAFVFAGASSKIFASAETAKVGPTSAGSLSTLSGVSIALGGTYNLSGAGLGGSIRHALMYSGALSNGDIAYLLNGFAADVTDLTIGG